MGSVQSWSSTLKVTFPASSQVAEPFQRCLHLSHLEKVRENRVGEKCRTASGRRFGRKILAGKLVRSL